MATQWGHSLVMFSAPEDRLPDVKAAFTAVIRQEDRFRADPNWNYEIDDLRTRFTYPPDAVQRAIDSGATWCLEYSTDDYADRQPFDELCQALPEIEFSYFDNGLSFD